MCIWINTLHSELLERAGAALHCIAFFRRRFLLKLVDLQAPLPPPSDTHKISAASAALLFPHRTPPDE